MRAIGGYFELETLKKAPYHSLLAVPLTSGRSCLSLFIEEAKPSLLWIPYYCCDAVLEPLKRYGIPWIFYSIDEDLNPLNLPDLKYGEYFLYINYFGVKGRAVQALHARYGLRLIVDHSQAFFEKPPLDQWAFNSARKFLGVPDGAYFYSPYPLRRNFPLNHNIDWEHLITRLVGKTEEGYSQYRRAEEKIPTSVLGMSSLARMLLSSIDYKTVAQMRKQNFSFFHSAFKGINHLKLEWDEVSVPLCYPLLTSLEMPFERFHKRRIFIPRLWADCEKREVSGFDFERSLSRRLLPLPVDQRLSLSDCASVVQFVSSCFV